VQCCHMAFDREDRKQWLSEEEIHIDTWSKILDVAGTAKLYSSELQPLLPANISTLSLLAKLSEEELDQAIEEGVIRPDLSYRSLAAWRKSRTETRERKPELFNLLPFVVALAPQANELDAFTVRVAIEEALSRLSAKGQLIHLDEVSALKEKSEPQWQLARLEDIRKLVNDIIAPKEVTLELLEKPQKEINEVLKLADNDSHQAVAVLKVARDSILGSTKQKRYQCRQKLTQLAWDQNDTALFICKNLYGQDLQTGIVT